MFNNCLILFQVVDTELGFSDWVSIIKDIIVALGVILGLIIGHKGLRRLLIENVIKERLAITNEANIKVKSLAEQIISKINDLGDTVRAADEDDIIYINSLTKKLVNSSINTSPEVHTLAFLLYETTKDFELVIDKRIKNSRRLERRTASDFYRIVSMTASRISYFAGSIVDVPNSSKTIKYQGIRKEIRKYLGKTGFETLKNYSTGLELQSSSAIPLLFQEIINRSSSDYIFKKKFFEVLQSNIPVLFYLYLNEIYFPLILKSSETDMFGFDRKLYLTHVNSKRTSFGESHGREYFEFIYSNINPRFSFVDTITKKTLTENYTDDFIDFDTGRFKRLQKKFVRLGDESFMLECDSSDAKEYFERVEHMIKKYLKNL